MRVLLILKEDGQQDVRLVVYLQTEMLQRQVSRMILEDRPRDAFDLVVSRGMVEHYLPQGTKLPLFPDLTLIEDLL
ncbi:MAG: hypothetical protein HQL18_00460 [Candidatus Omnitrophica bacterium]|nr:hypothetical protein [Candidatus Omnitrophota bacterium]